jgi:SlyX protein
MLAQWRPDLTTISVRLLQSGLALAVENLAHQGRTSLSQKASGMEEQLEERIVDLEIQITHQSGTIDELSEMVAKQWDMIDRLGRQVGILKEALAELEDGMEAPAANKKPPHY